MYEHTWKRTYICMYRWYIYTYAYTHIDIHVCMGNIYIHRWVGIQDSSASLPVHAYIPHTPTHTYMYIPEKRTPTSPLACLWVHKHTYNHTTIQLYNHTTIQLYNHTTIQPYNYIYTCIHTWKDDSNILIGVPLSVHKHTYKLYSYTTIYKHVCTYIYTYLKGEFQSPHRRASQYVPLNNRLMEWRQRQQTWPILARVKRDYRPVVRLYMCVCIYVCMYVCMYVCVRKQTWPILARVKRDYRPVVRLYMCVCVCMYVCMCAKADVIHLGTREERL